VTHQLRQRLYKADGANIEDEKRGEVERGRSVSVALRGGRRGGRRGRRGRRGQRSRGGGQI
jgi:hypothetical protein